MVMNDRPFPFYYKDKQVMEELLKNVSSMIKDSDASEEKEVVRSFLQKVSEAITFVAVGSSNVGKSSFLNRLFQSALFEKENGKSTRNIIEYRYGASEASLQADEYTTRIFRVQEELNGLQIVDMQGVDQMGQVALLEYVKKYIYKSSVVFAVFDAQSVKDYDVWDLLEGVEARKVVFIMTKCDLATPDVIEENESRLRQYMKEAGLQAPIFRVSSVSEAEELYYENGYEGLGRYVSEHIIGVNPVLTKQQENLYELKNMLGRLAESFELRRQQYESDALILKNINSAIDTFIRDNRVHIDNLKEALRREIEKEVDAYQNEIIAKLDPHKIKERFPNGSADFVDYLNLINEGYRKRMTDNINRKTQESVQSYLNGLEQVFEKAVGYFQKREILISLEDKFYGSMVESKKSMVLKTANNMEATKDYYHSLSNASTELFMKLWKARGDRDRIVGNVNTAGKVTGAAAGIGAGIAVAHGIGATAAGAAVGAVLWPVVGAIIGVVLISKIAREIASANTLPDLEKKVAGAIAEFKEEVAKTKIEMTQRVLDTVERMFQIEVENVDKSFSGFRMAVNIDSKNIPLLEDRLKIINSYVAQIKEMEERRLA